MHGTGAVVIGQRACRDSKWSTANEPQVDRSTGCGLPTRREPLVADGTNTSEGLTSINFIMLLAAVARAIN